MASLGDLKALQKVDLSHNKLEGHIPSYLTDLASWVYLNLSYNDLKGAVPKDGVFKNLSAISLQGNVQLYVVAFRNYVFLLAPKASATGSK